MHDGKANQKRTWISPAILVKGRASTLDDTGYGLLVIFQDCRGQRRPLILPRKSLYGDGAEALNELIDRGFEPSRDKGAIKELKEYLCRSEPKNWVRYVSRVGWHDGVFVFPDRTVGRSAAGEEVIFHTEEPVSHKYSTAGTLEEWQQKVSRPCRDNSRLLFALSCAFAAPLLQLAGMDNGGFHFKGLSTVGKTTALIAAGSVFGGDAKHGFIQTWRATANGLESQAVLHNDCLLPLDEIGQVFPKEISEIVYFLGNGQGKQRSTKSGGARAVNAFRLLTLSTGERSINELIDSSGTAVRGGHGVRLIEIPADPGNGNGIFESLHEDSSGASLSTAITTAAKAFYGTPIRDFLKIVVDRKDELGNELFEGRRQFTSDNLPKNSSPEIERVLKVFGHVATAGEIATTLGITKWQPGEATWAAKECFKAHLEKRTGLGAHDVELGIGMLSRFLQVHGSSRFRRLGTKESEVRSQPLAGWIGVERIDSTELTVYFIPGEVFAGEILKGVDAEDVAKELLKRGHLLVNHGSKEGNRLQYQKRLPLPGTSKTKPMRIYAIISSLLGEGDEEEG